MKKEKPSKTAYKVALNILALGAKPEMAGILPSGIVNATEKLLISSGVASAKTVRLYRSRRMVRVYEFFDWMMPGQFEGFACRKAFCERQVRQSIDAGARQVLVLGAGYDTMGWRLAPEFPNVNFFEIDHPATACLKALGIKEMGLRPNLYLIAEDLSERKLSDVLSDNVDWRLSAQTVIVAEGLLQYLSPVEVRDLFAQCAAITGECRIVFTYISTGEDGRPDCGPRTRLVLWLLKVGGEPWLWSVRPEELGQFLKSVGWINAPELEGAAGKHGVEMYAVATKSSRTDTEQGTEGDAANHSP
ncbi:MAG: class I SAM-dependent methyltransferase [Pirellulales bacterium]|nr:class I SAM-dependent methyltransferase [Pirellulales bacterium]